MKRRGERDYQNIELAKSFIKNGRPLIRGTKEWDNREIQRLNAGCKVYSPSRKWGDV